MPLGPTSSEAEHVFPVGTQTHTHTKNTYMGPTKQTNTNKTTLLRCRQHFWSPFVPFSGDEILLVWRNKHTHTHIVHIYMYEHKCTYVVCILLMCIKYMYYMYRVYMYNIDPSSSWAQAVCPLAGSWSPGLPTHWHLGTWAPKGHNAAPVACTDTAMLDSSSNWA